MRIFRPLALLLSAVIAVVGLTSLSAPTAAQADTGTGTLLVTESFSGTSVEDSEWSALGDACLTQATGAAPAGASNLAGCTRRTNAPASSVNPGFLQLTDSAAYRSGGVVYNKPIPGNGGVAVEFDQWQYGGTGADGIGFFLTDGSTSLTATGGAGGSLGYAPKNGVDGVNGGYLGVGLDPWGNYADAEGNKDVGCTTKSPGRTGNIVGLRGPGQGLNGYCWLTGTVVKAGQSNLPGNLRGTSSDALQGRHVKITISGDARPAVTVQIDFHDGVGLRTVSQYTMAQAAPATYKMGFLGSTGSSTDTHLIQNVSISSLTPLGRLNIVKQIDNRTSQPSSYKEGDTIPYTFLVSNTSSLAPLTDVAVHDNQASNIVCPRTSLGVQGTSTASMVCAGSHKVTAAEAVAGTTFVNTAYATGDDSGNLITSANSTVSAAITTPAPALKITKRAILADTVLANSYADPGESITYQFDVTNTGNVTVQNVAVTDPLVGDTISPASQTLAPGEKKTFTSTYTRTVAQADVDAGTALTNTAQASGTTLNSTAVTSPAYTATVAVTPASPKLVITKNAILNDEILDNDAADAGETVSYSFEVRNTGNVTLTNVTVTDAKVAGLHPTSVATLVPGGTASFTAEPYTVTQADIDAGGSLSNSATATGTSPAGAAGAAVASAAYVNQVPIAPQVPGLFLTKKGTLQDTNNSGLAEAGESIAYTFTVVNTGNVTLKNVGISDSRISGTSPTTLAMLAPKQSAVFTADPYTVTQSDDDTGEAIVNTATAYGTNPSGTQTVSPASTATEPVPLSHPSLSLKKTPTLDDVNGNNVADEGETISYTFVVTNDGNVTVSGISISDPDASGIAPSTVDSLLPGGSTTFTSVARAVTQAEIDAGAPIVNTATAAGTDPQEENVTSPAATASVPVAAAVTDLRINKIATLGDTNGNGQADANEPITYSFVVTNAGNVTLQHVRIADQGVTGISPVEVDRLAPGEQRTFAADAVTVQQSDVDRGGSIVNTATATAETTTGTAVSSGADTETTPLVAQNPGLTITKEPVFDDTDGDGRVGEGDLVSYRFTVTNTGNITMTDVRVSDEAVAGITPESVDLGPGSSADFVSTERAVTQAEIDAGTPIENVATASGQQSTAERFTSLSARADIDVELAAPALVLSKVAEYGTNNDSAEQGSAVVYRFRAENTGNVTLHDVAITDEDFTGVGELSQLSCPEARTVVPGDFLDCTAIYTVDQRDVDAGFLDNSAHAEAVTPAGNAVESTQTSAHVVSLARPALTLTKSADRTTLVAGQTVTYSFTVVNTGNVTLTDVGVDEGAFSGTGELSAVTCQAATLAPDGSVACQATYVVQQEDIDAGSLSNTATATGTPPVGEAVSSEAAQFTIDAVLAPALTVTKTADRESVALGQTVTYTLTAANTGNVTLSDVALSDEDFTGSGELSGQDCRGDRTLAPNASLVCDLTYVVTQEDIDAGGLSNAATATATSPAGDTVSSDRPVLDVDAPQAPALSLVKEADRDELVVGQTLAYTLTATNTGTVTLSDVAIAEGEFTGAGALTVVDCPTDASLAPGASVSCAASYVVQQADADAGALSNTATATGTSPAGVVVSAEPATSTVTTDPVPALSVVKTADRDTLVVGDTITYDFAVTNTGTVTLTGVGIDEGVFTGTGAVSAARCDDTALAPEDSTDCTATYVVQQADVDAGALSNTATARGTSPAGAPVVSEPSAVTVIGEAAPALSVQKTADTAQLIAGDTVTYTFIATNTGTVTLSDVAIVEGEFTGAGAFSAVDCPADRSIAPGATLSCTATYVVSQADVDAGSLANTATAQGTPPAGARISSAPSTVVLAATPVAALAVVKSVDATALVAGKTVAYSFVATNTGTVTLSDVAVVEQEFSGTGELSVLDCPEDRTLAPGAQLVCDATYTVQQADVDTGVLSNTAIAQGTPPGAEAPISSDPSTARTDQAAAPALTVVKTADATSLVAGATVTYDFLVTNTGTLTLSGVAIDEGDFTGSGALSAVECADDAPLLPGEQRLCTATYTVPQADVDAGSVTNTATATATDPSGTAVVSEASRVVVTAAQAPGLRVVKTADQKTVRLGDTVTYTFTATNTGNVTLIDLQVIDRGFTGTGELSPLSCADDARTLAPGTALVCTATYVVQQGDVDAGTLANTAIARATPDTPDDPEPLSSDPSQVSTSVAPGILPLTGGQLAPWIVMLSLTMLLTGGVLVLIARRHRAREQC